MESNKGKIERAQISPPNFKTAVFKIEGLSPFVQLKVSEKAKHQMMEAMQGQKQKRGKARPARDFDDDYRQSHYQTTDAKLGIPASAFRNAIISACRLVNFKMTLAKLSVFVEADGYDKDDGTPLVFINGIPEKHISTVTNANGNADIRVRTMWRKWSAKVRIRWDADQFNTDDIANLLARVGLQVGVGEGRPDSRNSPGQGWGTFGLLGNAKSNAEAA